MTSDSEMRAKLVEMAFQMPSFQTMVSRKSSITNAFVSSIVPIVVPQIEEIDETLAILKIDPADVRCAYCGDRSSEWDHLRPLVLNQRPTGYISEIANLVPACGKCNQSKGNKPWRDWMLSNAKLSPTGRGLQDVLARVERLAEYEKWRQPTLVSFEAIVGKAEWDRYWSLCEAVNDELRRCHEESLTIRRQAVASLGNPAAK